jgi:hypothetical protein
VQKRDEPGPGQGGLFVFIYIIWAIIGELPPFSSR